jgi:alkylhydroperoxidase family enzyme
MTWIRTVGPEKATGLLGKIYRQAIDRSGKVFGILRCQSPRPETLEASTALYLEVMQSDRSQLSRARREMIATAVSRANRCFY